MSSPVKEEQPVARCPLGFTGPPPPGHPSIPGFSSSSSTAGDGKKAWNPWLILTLDAIFLLICVIVAKYGIPYYRSQRAKSD